MDYLVIFLPNRLVPGQVVHQQGLVTQQGFDFQQVASDAFQGCGQLIVGDLAFLYEIFFSLQLALRLFYFLSHVPDLDHVAVSLVTVNRNRTHLQEHGKVLVLEVGATFCLSCLPHALLGGEVAEMVGVSDHFLQGQQVETTVRACLLILVTKRKQL